ncbi:hypothetical protein [Pseudoxanthomonas sp. Root630]|uniref:hypothetical protein n=1 Tax=Pseudoxanthomonas sp. Root630 TaxID=1736574 RepID=UPI0012DF78AB|nr:hypothetical protein [Pseudoxanthomonas sp. Root630]
MSALACGGSARAVEAVLPDLPSCMRAPAPDDAGVVATPGGFMLVHPRNADLPDDYTGCKTLWVMDVDPVPWRWATLWFRDGRLQRVVSTLKDAPAPRICDMPGVVLPAGYAPAPACEGLDDHPWVSLRLPSWPRVCANDTPPAVCDKEPE